MCIESYNAILLHIYAHYFDLVNSTIKLNAGNNNLKRFALYKNRTGLLSQYRDSLAVRLIKAKVRQ